MEFVDRLNRCETIEDTVAWIWSSVTYEDSLCSTITGSVKDLKTTVWFSQPAGVEGHSRLFPVCGDRDMPVRVSLIRQRRACLLPATLHRVSANTVPVSAMDQQYAVQ